MKQAADRVGYCKSCGLLVTYFRAARTLTHEQPVCAFFRETVGPSAEWGLPGVAESIAAAEGPPTVIVDLEALRRRFS